MGLFGFGNKYPYTDFHELNLDWILSVVRSLQGEMETFVNVNTIKYADPILWDISSQYEQNTLVQDADGITYLSKIAVPAGVSITNTDYWLKVADFSQLADIIKRSICSQDDGASATSTENRSEGDLLWLNNYLYIVVRTINVGDAYVEGGVNPNIEKVTVEQLLKTGGVVKEAIATADDGTSTTSTANRAVGDLVWLNDHLYEVIAAITTGDSYVIGTNIQLITVEQLFDDTRTYINNQDDHIRHEIVVADDGTSATSTANRAIGDYLWLNNNLYTVTAAISIGDPYTVGTNIDPITVEQMISIGGSQIPIIIADIAAINATLDNNLDRVANVKDYGAVGDGVTDDTASVNLAIADINGGTKDVLYFPIGTYSVTDLTPITAGCKICGQSKNTTIIKCQAGHGHIFNLSNFNVGEICDLTFSDDDTVNDDFIIYLTTGNFVRIHNLFCNVGRLILNGDVNANTVTGFCTQIDHITGVTHQCMLKLDGARSVTFVDACVVNSEIADTGSCCIEINNPNVDYDTLIITNSALQRFVTPFVMNVPAGRIASNIWGVNCVFDQTQSRNIVVNCYGHVYRIYFDNCWFASLTEQILMQGLSGGKVADVAFKDNIFEYAGGYIMNAQYIDGLRFDGNIIPSFDSIAIVADYCSYVDIVNNKIGPNGSNVSPTGLTTVGVLTRVSSHILIVNNDLNGLTDGVQISSCTDYIANDNLGEERITDNFNTGETRYDSGQLEYWNGSTWVQITSL